MSPIEAYLDSYGPVMNDSTSSWIQKCTLRVDGPKRHLLTSWWTSGAFYSFKNSRFEFSSSYVTCQNGVVERKNRYLCEMARTMLDEHKTLRRYWAEAVNTACHVGVTEPPKIIPYYRLGQSTWPLSNNKEVFCRLCRAMSGKSPTTGSLICAKPTRRRDKSTSSTLHKSPQVMLLQTRFSHIKVKVI
jgi:hypothetical protein